MYNKEVNRAKCLKWRDTHVEQAREIGRINDRKSWQKHKEFVQSFLVGRVCAKCTCGEDLVFHHVDPTTKLFNVSRGHHPEDAIKAEIAKCVIWCRPCHMRHHRAEKLHQQSLEPLQIDSP